MNLIQFAQEQNQKSSSSVNHVYLVDVSGSMYSVLPKMREHIKNVITMATQPDDTFTLIYFSGRGECGTVFENLRVGDIANINMMKNAVDRFIKPIMLTGFAEPMELAMNVSKSLEPSNVNNFVMLTDGYDNQSTRADIIRNSEKLKDHFATNTFIEFGWYCDRPLLEEMAEKAEACLVFADGYTSYEGVLESSISGSVRTPVVEVETPDSVHALYVRNHRVNIVDASSGVVKVPEDITALYTVGDDVSVDGLDDDALYMMMFYALKQNKRSILWDALGASGDVFLINAFNNAFNRQELSNVESLILGCINDKSQRYIDGKDRDHMPAADATTVLDVLQMLDASTGTALLVDSPSFKYSRTGAARVIDTEKDGAPEQPVFIQTPNQEVSMTGLVFNQSRANVSMQTKVHGIVKVPDNDFGIKTVNSKQTRNYTIIRDGILNTPILPLVMDRTTFDTLSTMMDCDILADLGNGRVMVEVDLNPLPIINRQTVEMIDAERENTRNEIVSLSTQRLELQATMKVVKHLLTEADSKNDKILGLVDEYGEDAAKWLSSIGVRDYGFSPVGTTSKKGGDTYEATELSIKVRGCSSLPSIATVNNKVSENKKLNAADSLIANALEAYASASVENLNRVMSDTNTLLRKNIASTAELVYGIIVARIWPFNDDGGDFVTDVDVAGVQTKMTISLGSKSIEI